MKYGIFGDVHGNLEGLEAVLSAMDAAGTDQYLCMGDVVGYGADPNACCERIRELPGVCLFGNHDQACIASIDLSWFNDAARQAAEWTQAQLEPANRQWLGSLEPVHTMDGFVIVHSALPDPWRWTYVASATAAARTIAAADYQLVFVGHTHVAEAYRRVGDAPVRRRALHDGGTVYITPESRFVINCGSCGQPRDHNPRACYGIYDTEAGTVEVHRVRYDIERAAEKILRAGLPDYLARRLFIGR